MRKIYKTIKITLFALLLSVVVPFSFFGCGGTYGTFYDLSTAYDAGFISAEDIKTISELHNNGNYVTLTNDDAVELRRAYAKQFPRKNFTFNDVDIMEFLGEYSNCLAVMLHYNDTAAVEVEGWESIAGAEFHYGNGFRILIYNKN